MACWEQMVRSMAPPMSTEVGGEVPPIEALPSAVALSWHSYDIITAIIRACRPTFCTQIPGNLVRSIYSWSFKPPKTLQITNFSIHHRSTQQHSIYRTFSLNNSKVIKYSTAKTTPPSPNVSKILTHASPPFTTIVKA